MASPAMPQLDNTGNNSKWATKTNRAPTVKEGPLRPSDMFYSNVRSIPHDPKTCPTSPKPLRTGSTLVNSSWTIPLHMHLWTVQLTVKQWWIVPGGLDAGLRPPPPVFIIEGLSRGLARREIGRCHPELSPLAMYSLKEGWTDKSHIL